MKNIKLLSEFLTHHIINHFEFLFIKFILKHKYLRIRLSNTNNLEKC